MKPMKLITVDGVTLMKSALIRGWQSAGAAMYSASTQGSDTKSLPRPLVISGPSGGGKSTILKRAFQEYPKAFAFSVSHTTRQPRAGEVDGVDYHYVSRETMLGMIERGEFLENAEFSGNMYGTSIEAVSSIQATGRICVLDIEIFGVRCIKKSPINARFILLKPPSLGELERRLRARGTETEESLVKRLDRAKTDLLQVTSEPELFDIVIENDKLETAYASFIEYVADDLKAFNFKS